MPQLTYQGSMAGESTATASSTMPARRIASGPPSRAAHHCRTAITSSAVPPMIRATLMNGCLGRSKGISRSQCTNSPTPVGSDIQFTIIDGALSAGSQPRSTRAARVIRVNTPAKTPMPAAVALAIRALWEPLMCAAQTSTRNGSATPALAFTAIAAVTSVMPTTCRPRRANSEPVARRPMTSRSLCPPPTMWMIIIGLATTTHSATGTRPPRRRVSSGSAHTSSSRPSTSVRRMSRTPAMMFVPTVHATVFASRMNSGPYGAGVSCQK